jgi:hypothetical protein
MAYTKYSLTPADNNAAPPNGAPEGMLPSGVNDTMRDMMSQIRDVGDGIRGGTYTMTAPIITGGSITGITDLAVADGGTGASSITANSVILGNGSSALSGNLIAPGTSGNVLTSNGTTWTSAATSGFDSGTVILFYQAAAPTGWTKVTTQDNKALRVVSGTGGVSGGTTAFSSVFTNQTVSTSVSISGTTGATTLSTSQIPSHNHSTPTGLTGNLGSGGFGYASPDSGQTTSDTSGSTGGGGSHDHSFSGSGSGTSSAVTLNVQYIDIILCSKN